MGYSKIFIDWTNGKSFSSPPLELNPFNTYIEVSKWHVANEKGTHKFLILFSMEKNP